MVNKIPEGEVTNFSDEERACGQYLRNFRQSTSGNTILAARTAPEAFAVTWGGKYGRLVARWETDWEELMAFMDYPKYLRQMIGCIPKKFVTTGLRNV